MAYFDVKHEVVDRLKKELYDLGFVYVSESPGYFMYKPNEEVQVDFFLGLSTKVVQQKVSRLGVGFVEVERILLKVGSLPSFDVQSVKSKGKVRNTIRLNDPRVQSLLFYDVDSKETLDVFVKNIISYIVNHGLPFYERYSTLENVLDKMKELRREGKLWNQILDGGPEFLFKGLIISKLCQDTEFDELQSYVEKLVTEQLKDQAWVDAFESMKVVLSNTYPPHQR